MKHFNWMAGLTLLVGLVLLTGGIGIGLSYFGFRFFFGQGDFLAAELGQAGGFFLGVLGGGLALIHGAASLRGVCSASLRLPPFYLFWLAFALVLGLGSLLLNLNAFVDFVFPCLFALGASLPTLAVLAWGWKRLGWPLSWRQGSLALVSGASLSVLVVILLSTVLPLLMYLLLSPLSYLAYGLQAAFGAGSNFIERLFFSPALFFYLLYTALVAPIPEEFAKALGPVLFGRRRIRTEAQALAIGLASGAGFAILENMLYQSVYAAMNGWVWGGITFIRAFGVVMHALCTGIVALGWFRLPQRGLSGLLKAYGLAVLLHTFWNGGFETLAYLAGLEYYAESGPAVSIYGEYVSILLVAYVILLGAGLWVMLGRLARQLTGPAVAPDASPLDGLGDGSLSPRALGAWAVACAFILIPLGASLGQAWPQIWQVIAP